MAGGTPVSAGPFLDQIRGRKLLEQALETGEMPPAFLFVGPHGVGKEEAAIAFAQALNCGQSVTSGEPELFDIVADDGKTESDTASGNGKLGGCGSCSSCDRIGRYSHPDVIVRLPLPRPEKRKGPADPSEALVFKAENPYRDPEISGSNLAIGIDDIRDIIRQLAYAPVEGRRRVIILRESERMIGDAQTALLKSLEEPPPHTIFILTTDRPNYLLSTVRSRCRTVHFGPLPADVISAYLEERSIVSPEGMDLAALARGSIKRALTLVDGSIPGREEALQLLAWTFEGRHREALAWAEDFTFRSGMGAQAGARQILDELLSLSRDLAVVQSGSELSLHNPDKAALLRSIGKKAADGAGERALEAVLEARGEVDRFLNLALIYATLLEAFKPLGT